MWEDINKNFIFQKDVGHYLNTCIDFHEQILWLLKNNYISEYIEEEQALSKHVDHKHVMIISGGLSLAREFNRARKQYTRYSITPDIIIVSLTKEPKYIFELIMFTNKDFKCISYPHDDALIAMMIVAGTTLNKVFVDPRRVSLTF